MEEEIIKEIERIGYSLEEVGKSLRKIASILQESKNDKKICVYMKDDDLLKDKDYQIKDEIIDFLEKKKFSIVNISNDEYATSLESVSKFIGDKYEYIKDFLKSVKKSLNTGIPVKMYMKDFPEQKIAYICQLALNLHNIAFLKNYRYLNSPKFILYADPLREPLVINFINGKWLENYLILKIRDILNEMGLTEGKDFDLLQSIQVKLPNAKNFELDILFKIIDKIFWFEAKTGEYQQYIHKYSEVSKLLGIPQDRAFMVITEITPTGADTVSTLFNMTVCNLDTFESKFKETLKEISIEDK